MKSGYPPLFYFIAEAFRGGHVSEPLERIRQLASEIADDLGVELVRVTFSGRGKKGLLRVFIDKRGGVTIGDCETFSRRFEALLDVEDMIKSSYVLEVSSPGLDRPIQAKEDFERYTGRLIRIVTKERIENQTFFVGRLIETGEGWIRVLLEDRKAPKHIYIPFEAISRAHLEVEMRQE